MEYDDNSYDGYDCDDESYDFDNYDNDISYEVYEESSNDNNSLVTIDQNHESEEDDIYSSIDDENNSIVTIDSYPQHY